jgi:hypothetical protein
MIFTNKHIVLFILIIIIVVFIVHYDVYLVPKNEPLCKPVFVIKRELNPELRAKLNKSERVVFHEAINNMAQNDIYEGFDNTELKIPDKTICKFTVNDMKNSDKIKIIDSVCNIIAYIPTPLNDDDIKDIITYYSIIYDKSNDIDDFYKKVEIDFDKNKDDLMKSRFAQLVLFLIGRCDIKQNTNIQDLNIKDDTKEIKQIVKDENISKKVINMIQKKIKKKLKKMNEQNQNNISYNSDGLIDNTKNYNYNYNYNYGDDFDVEKIKNMGGFNLNDGPSSYEISDQVDRVTQSTRIGPYHHKELIYNDSIQNSGNIGNPGNSFYVNNFKNQQDSYTDRAKDYLRTEACSSDYYNTSTQAYNLF